MSRIRNILSNIFLSPEERRLRAGWRVLVQYLLLYLVAIFTAVIFTGKMYFSLSFNLFIFSVIISVIAIPLSVFVARRFIDHRSFVSLGFRWDADAFKDLLVGFFIAGGMMALVYLIELAAGWLHYQGPAWEGVHKLDFLSLILLAVIVFLAVGFYEELLSRGYRLQNFEVGTNTPVAVLLSSLIFAMEHLSNPNIGWAAVVGLFFSGIFLAFAYLRTRRLWLPIGLHIGWNIFEGIVFGFPVSGMNIPGFIAIRVDGPQYFTGGAFGPEAGLVLLPALLFGYLLVFWYTRNRAIGKNE